MFCENCGNRLSDTDVFCTACGTKVPSATKPVAPAPAPTEAVASNPENFGVASDTSAPINPPNVPNPTYGENPVNPNPAPFVQNNMQSSNYKSANYQNSTPVPPPAPAPEPVYFTEVKPPMPHKPKSSKGLVATIVICSVLLVVLASVFVYITLNKDKNNDDSVVKTPSVSSDSEPNKPIDKPVKSDSTPDEEDEEDVVVNKIDATQIESLIANNSSLTDFGIYVCNLNNGYEFGYNENDSFYASAMVQVVILDALSSYANDTNIDVNDETYKFYYLENNGKEAPDSKDDDMTYVSLADYVEDIAMYGDNNKCNRMVDYLGGFDDINDYLYYNGYKNTEINRKVYTDYNSDLIDEYADPNVTTAKEIALIYKNLISNSAFGSKSYMSNIFKSVNINGDAIGLKKYIPSEYTISSANGVNTESSNDVAIISDGETEILVSILAHTQSDAATDKSYLNREAVQNLLINYIIETQFK